MLYYTIGLNVFFPVRKGGKLPYPKNVFFGKL